MRSTATRRMAITAAAALALGGLVLTSTTVAAVDDAGTGPRLVAFASESQLGLCMYVPNAAPRTRVVVRNCATAVPDEAASAFAWVDGQLRPVPRLPESGTVNVCVTGGLQDLSNLTLEPCTGAPGQVWTFDRSTHQLRNGRAKCADPYLAIQDGRGLFAANCSTHPLQRWTVTEIEVLHSP